MAIEICCNTGKSATNPQGFFNFSTLQVYSLFEGFYTTNRSGENNLLSKQCLSRSLAK